VAKWERTLATYMVSGPFHSVSGFLADLAMSPSDSDHICMLETSLLHHETVLRHCQSAYTAHLGTAFAITRVQTDQAILALSIVSIGVLPMQFVVSE
jgi:hypothetical protein